MHLKIDFLCRDPILPAPLALDLVLLLDFAQGAGMHRIQECRSFYFQCPMHALEVCPRPDIFFHLIKLKNTLSWMNEQDLITHLSLAD